MKNFFQKYGMTVISLLVATVTIILFTDLKGVIGLKILEITENKPVQIIQYTEIEMNAKAMKSYGFSVTGDVIIPDTFEHDNKYYKVTSISEFGFAANDKNGNSQNLNINSITVPSTVRTIGQCAFANLEMLDKVTLNEGLETIGKCAFKNTKLLSVKIPDSTKLISEAAFQDCYLLTQVTTRANTIERYAFSHCAYLSTLYLNEGVENLGEYAFFNCGILEEVTLPKSLLTIGKKTFSQTGLKAVEIPMGVSKLNSMAFIDCDNLETITVHSDNINYNVEDDVIYTLNDIVYYKNTKENTEYVFPENIEAVKEQAFYNCDKLTEITLSDNLKKIHTDAFKGCINIDTISYKGVDYTRKEDLLIALTYNKVKFDENVFDETKLI